MTPWLGIERRARDRRPEDIERATRARDALYGVRATVAKPACSAARCASAATRRRRTTTTRSPTCRRACPGMRPDNRSSAARASAFAADAGLFVEERWFLGDGALRDPARPARWTTSVSPASRCSIRKLTVVEHVGAARRSPHRSARYHESPLVTDLDPIFKRDTLRAARSRRRRRSPARPTSSACSRRARPRYYQQQSQLPVDAISGATPISANGGEQSGGLFGIARELSTRSSARTAIARTSARLLRTASS